jgi:3-hydroxybutyrate dehydrogenase
MLITGAGSGIGEGLVRHFAARRFHVIAADLIPDRVADLVAELRRDGLSAEALMFDISSPESIDAALCSVKAGLPDVLINSSGLAQTAPLEKYPPEDWQHLISVMLTGSALLTRALLPVMRAGGFGRIVNIGSVHAQVASPFESAHVAATHGLLGFAKAVALETADCDITINTVCPSPIRSPQLEARIDELAATRGVPRDQVAREILLKAMPKGAFIGIDEVAAAVEFLLADTARNITGQCITIDGGWTAQ